MYMRTNVINKQINKYMYAWMCNRFVYSQIKYTTSGRFPFCKGARLVIQVALLDPFIESGLLCV